LAQAFAAVVSCASAGTAHMAAMMAAVSRDGVKRVVRRTGCSSG